MRNTRTVRFSLLASILFMLTAGLMACEGTTEDEPAEGCDPATNDSCICANADDTEVASCDAEDADETCACELVEGPTGCDPATDDTCVCANEDGTVVDACDAEDADDSCMCEVEEPPAGCDPTADDTCVCANEDGTVVDACDAGDADDSCMCQIVEPPMVRYVLVEDLTTSVSGEFPGVDADFVRLTKANGDEHYASRHLDFSIPTENNSAADPDQILDEPDANCMADSGNFVSLGGEVFGGFIIVEFGDDAPVAIENGDTIVVGDLGRTLCPGMFDDDPGRVSISISTDINTFQEVSTFNGASEITISGIE